MNVSINPHWAAFKAHMIRCLGREHCGDFLRHAAAVMDMEAKRYCQPIEGQAREVQERAR